MPTSTLLIPNDDDDYSDLFTRPARSPLPVLETHLSCDHSYSPISVSYSFPQRAPSPATSSATITPSSNELESLKKLVQRLEKENQCLMVFIVSIHCQLGEFMGQEGRWYLTAAMKMQRSPLKLRWCCLFLNCIFAYWCSWDPSIYFMLLLKNLVFGFWYWRGLYDWFCFALCCILLSFCFCFCAATVDITFIFCIILHRSYHNWYINHCIYNNKDVLKHLFIIEVLE